jgi:hypothetical protein
MLVMSGLGLFSLTSSVCGDGPGPTVTMLDVAEFVCGGRGVLHAVVVRYKTCDFL